MTNEEMEAARLRAYRLWESQGRPDGQHESHWNQALKELGLISPAGQPAGTTLREDEGSAGGRHEDRQVASTRD